MGDWQYISCGQRQPPWMVPQSVNGCQLSRGRDGFRVWWNFSSLLDIFVSSPHYTTATATATATTTAGMYTITVCNQSSQQRQRSNWDLSSILIIPHVDEREASWSAGLMIVDDLQIINRPVVLKHVTQITFLSVETQAKHTEASALTRVVLYTHPPQFTTAQQSSTFM